MAERTLGRASPAYALARHDQGGMDAATRGMRDPGGGRAGDTVSQPAPALEGRRIPERPDVLIIGGGPAGLISALELAKHHSVPVVVEKSSHLGGISRTEVYKGYRFDIGGHRFFTKVPEVEALWHEILGDQLLVRRRLSRIFYGGRFYPYPLKLWPTLRNLGVVESLRILGSYLGARLRPEPGENASLEAWVSRRFGPRLYETFFKTYTEKVWGMPCGEISADWASQRIRTLSLKRALMAGITGRGNETSLIESFLYPELGPGQMWERCAELVEDRGGAVHLATEAFRLRRNGDRITSVSVRSAGGEVDLEPRHVVSSMPINHLIGCIDPPPPAEVLRAAAELRFRDFIVVALVIGREHLFPDNWIYVHSPAVRVGRIQNFKNWSSQMVPADGTSCLGLEYFCTRGDDLWRMPDEQLVLLAARELETIGLARSDDLQDGTVIRQAMAYPIYDAGYADRLTTIRQYLERLLNLQTVGRGGMHRYNNQDHAMLTGLLAARNLLGARHDLWSVNVESAYHEDAGLERSRRAVGRGQGPSATG